MYRFLFLKSHNILLRVGVNRFMRMISAAGIAVSVLFAACHVVENYVFLDPSSQDVRFLKQRE